MSRDPALPEGAETRPCPKPQVHTLERRRAGRGRRPGPAALHRRLEHRRPGAGPPLLDLRAPAPGGPGGAPSHGPGPPRPRPRGRSGRWALP